MYLFLSLIIIIYVLYRIFTKPHNRTNYKKLRTINGVTDEQHEENLLVRCWGMGTARYNPKTRQLEPIET